MCLREGQSPEHVAMQTFFSGTQSLDEVLKNLFLKIHRFEAKTVESIQLGLHLAERGDVPGVRRVLRNALEAVNQTPGLEKFRD